MKPEVGKQYTFEDEIIEVTDISNNGFCYKIVGGTGDRLRFAEYGSPIHEFMKIYEKKETNLDHYYYDLISDEKAPICMARRIITGKDCEYIHKCVDCQLQVLQWLQNEYESPKPKLTLFEKSILECAVNHGCEWIARDNQYNVVCVYENKPNRGLIGWQGKDIAPLWLFEDKFQFIQWTDEEPTYIPDLLKECEVVE